MISLERISKICALSIYYSDLLNVSEQDFYDHLVVRSQPSVAKFEDVGPCFSFGYNAPQNTKNAQPGARGAALSRFRGKFFLNRCRLSPMISGQNTMEVSNES